MARICPASTNRHREAGHCACRDNTHVSERLPTVSLKDKDKIWIKLLLILHSQATANQPVRQLLRVDERKLGIEGDAEETELLPDS